MGALFIPGSVFPFQHGPQPWEEDYTTLQDLHNALRAFTAIETDSCYRSFQWCGPLPWLVTPPPSTCHKAFTSLSSTLFFSPVSCGFSVFGGVYCFFFFFLGPMLEIGHMLIIRLLCLCHPPAVLSVHWPSQPSSHPGRLLLSSFWALLTPCVELCHAETPITPIYLSLPYFVFHWSSRGKGGGVKSYREILISVLFKLYFSSVSMMPQRNTELSVGGSPVGLLPPLVWMQL